MFWISAVSIFHCSETIPSITLNCNICKIMFILFMHDISLVAENMSSYTTIDLCCDLPCIQCWYYNVYKTLVVFSTLHFWHEFLLCVLRAGTLLGYGWCNVGSWLAQRWVMVGAMLGYGWCNVGSWLAQSWVMVGAMLGDGWPKVG